MSCEDIPSLLDLQKVKKHADDFGRLMGTGEGDSTNEVTGQVRPTYNKVMKSVGFKPGSGDFTTGFTVMSGQRDIAWYDPVSQNWYSYLGVIPSGGYTVLPGTNPVGSLLWAPRTDETLRSQLVERPLYQTMVGLYGIQDYPSVEDYGATGDGITDDTQAFVDAISSTPAGIPIHGTSGSYLLTSDVSALGRQFILMGGAVLGCRLVGALVQTVDPASGAWSYGVGESLQYGSYYKFGRNAGGPIGLTIGGGDREDGIDGNVLFPDVYAGWTTIMPSKYLSASELAIQPSSSAGACTTSSGGNTVSRVSGGDFLPEFVGRRIYIDQGRYLVSSVNTMAQTLTVTMLDGSAASLPGGGPLTFVVVGAKGSGICNTSGGTVTRVSGDPFVPLTNTEYRFKINGVSYQVSSVTDFNTIVTATSAGNQVGVQYEFWTSVDDLSSAIRVHRVSGAGFEENITMGAYAAGYFHIHAAGGGGRQYPLYIGSGYNTNGDKRRQISVQANGIVNLGGDSGSCSLEVEWRGDSASNSFTIGGADAGGGTPGMAVTGPDANIGISISSKGAGVTKFFSGNYGYQQFEIGHASAGTSWLGVKSDSFAQPRLYAAGLADNIDIQLTPKGAGRVILGQWATNADAAINGYITVKDSNGNIRKLATIA